MWYREHTHQGQCPVTVGNICAATELFFGASFPCSCVNTNKMYRAKLYSQVLPMLTAGYSSAAAPANVQAAFGVAVSFLLAGTARAIVVKDLQREIRESDPRYSDGTLEMCQPISEILDTRTRGFLTART